MVHDSPAIPTLYKKLLTLYPRPFREQLGESMEQTFCDLWRERRQQAKGGVFGFVLWMFSETAFGIGQEYIVLFKETHRMNRTLTYFRSPAVLGFLAILPFILLEWGFVITKGLSFDLRDVLDSVVVFGLLWLGVTAIFLILRPFASQLRAGGNAPAPTEPTSSNVLTRLTTNPKSAALISFVLALPFMFILALLILHIEPPLGPLTPLLKNPNPDQPHVLGTLIVVGAFLLAIVAGIIARTPLVWALQTGGSVLAHPLNLMLAVVILSFITTLVVGLAVDQYPCWIGVLNCD